MIKDAYRVMNLNYSPMMQETNDYLKILTESEEPAAKRKDIKRLVKKYFT